MFVIPSAARNLVRKVEIRSKARNDRRVLPHNSSESLYSLWSAFSCQSAVLIRALRDSEWVFNYHSGKRGWGASRGVWVLRYCVISVNPCSIWDAYEPGSEQTLISRHRFFLLIRAQSGTPPGSEQTLISRHQFFLLIRAQFGTPPGSEQSLISRHQFFLLIRAQFGTSI